MNPIIPAVDRDLLKAELTEDKRLRFTNRSNNEIYVVTWQDSPNVVREIGRLREIAFREAGGGTGEELDLDWFDTCDNPYKQMIVWDPETEEIIGGYRYILGTDVDFDDKGQPLLATSHMFNFSERFLKEYLPYTVELGRSFVAVDHQSTGGRRGLFALDNLWDGLGALYVVMPNCQYFFGKMTMYPSYNRRCRDMILYFLKKYYEDKDQLILPMHPLHMEHDPKEFDALFIGKNFKEDYVILNREVRSLGVNIPPLVNTYMLSSPTMKVFGTAINDGFGDVEETGIFIKISEITDEKRLRHIETFAMEHPELIDESVPEMSKIIHGVNKFG